MRTGSDCVVVGSGLVGAAAACALRLAGVQVRVVEARVAAVTDTRWYALSLASHALLQRLGVWDLLPPGQCAPYHRMMVWDGTARLTFTAAEAQVPHLGFMVAHAALLEALRLRLQMLAVPTTQASLQGLVLEAQAAQVQLNDGSTWRTQLVIGADGADSQTRQRAQLSVWRHDYQQSALFALVDHAITHEQTARQRFLATGPLALLPLPNQNCSALVWTLPQNQVDATLALPDTEFCLALEAASEGSVGAILACTPRRAFPLRAQQAARYCTLRLALLGDAAHVVHPLAGQGVNLGLLDVAALAEAVGTQRDIGSTLGLRHYERLRRSDNAAMLWSMSSLNRLFGAEQFGLASLRQQGLRALNGFAPAKRLLARAAVGLRPPATALTGFAWTI